MSGKAVLFTTSNPKLKFWNSALISVYCEPCTRATCCSIATTSLFIFMSIAKEISGLYWILKQHVDIQTDTDRNAHVSKGGESKRT